MRWLPIVVLLLAGCGSKSALQVGAPPPELPDLGPDLTRCVPSGPETCNGVDDDCDGWVDEALPLRPVGESVVFRDTGEGETGACDTCAWVRDLAVESTSAGMLAVWHLGYLGTEPQPNTYSRLLDDGGRPIGEILRHDTLLKGGWTTSAPHPDGMMITYCGRVRGGDDVTTRALFDARGVPIWEVRAQPDRSCGAWRPVSVRTGPRIFTAWTDNSSGPVMGHEHLIDIAGPDGESRDWEEVLPEGDGKPAFAVGHGRVVHVAAARPEPRVSVLYLQPYSLEGDPLGPAEVLVERLGPESFYGEPWVFPTPTGFVVHMGERSREIGGRIVLDLDREGRTVGDPRRYDTELELINTIDDAIAFRGGVIVASPIRDEAGESGYRVFFTNTRGETVDTWDPREDDEGYGDGVFVEHLGQLFLAYRRGVESPDGRARVQLRMWPLGCEP